MGPYQIGQRMVNVTNLTNEELHNNMLFGVEFSQTLADEMRDRMGELKPAIDEAKFLEDMLKVIDYRKEQKPASVTWPEVLEWFKKTYMPTDIFRWQDMAEYFDKSPSWATRRTQKLINEGLLESFGNGLLRRPAINLGQKMTIHPGG